MTAVDLADVESVREAPSGCMVRPPLLSRPTQLVVFFSFSEEPSAQELDSSDRKARDKLAELEQLLHNLITVPHAR